MYELYFDGASKNNPGLAGYGGVIYDDDKNEILTYAKKIIEPQTNNYAEYYGLYDGLKNALDNGISELKVYGDSNLVIQQMNGKWKVKSDNLKDVYKKCIELKCKFKFIEFNHVLRKFNKRADELANIGVESM